MRRVTPDTERRTPNGSGDRSLAPWIVAAAVAALLAVSLIARALPREDLQAAATPAAPAAPKAQDQQGFELLFDGTSFTGWDGDTARTWRIAEGAIVGGSLEAQVPHNEFLATTREFGDFVLEVQFKLLGSEGLINAGVQLRSQRVPKHYEMVGYQMDLGDPTWWGSLYDETRRNRVLAQSDMAVVTRVLRRGDWNDYEIRCQGRRIVAFINGAQTIDYTEPDGSIPQRGRIALQVHGGGKVQVWYRQIRLRPLP